MDSDGFSTWPIACSISILTKELCVEIYIIYLYRDFSRIQSGPRKALIVQYCPIVYNEKFLVYFYPH